MRIREGAIFLDVTTVSTQHRAKSVERKTENEELKAKSMEKRVKRREQECLDSTGGV
jgi:hypothetical protein